MLAESQQLENKTEGESLLLVAATKQQLNKTDNILNVLYLL
jgi:hypothetical protein